MGRWSGFTSTAAEIDHAGHRYRVELRLFTMGTNLSLLRDGEVIERASTPAGFDLEDGATIEVAATEHGFRRAVLRTGAGTTRLQPAAGTWEATRLHWGRRHPVANRLIAVGAGFVVVAGLLFALLQLLQVITSADVVRDLLGGWSFTMPVVLSPVALVVFGLAVGAAALDTALRMR
ncbi:hypothetical protein [Occultella gossypii]|uniref:Uncharacterized protein n=1 Tax=Occultella gossypii TaxID=2800820 RepID=A0ABS7S4M9_9MICO|nr:hypothetical protein [Occultella gossypii]MBZ2195306.1 hypothetical protein [Occultella gossypii]